MMVSGSFVPAHARCGDALFNVGEGCDDGDLGGFLDAFAIDASMGPLVGLTHVPADFPSGARRWLAGDPTRDRVVALASDGALLGAFATLPGAGIADVQVGADGVVYVASTTTDRIDRFLVTTGQSLGAFPLGGGLDAPQALAASGSFLYIASAGDAPIQRIATTTGALVGSFGQARGERDLAFDAAGNLFTVRGTSVHRWSALGADLGRFADASGDLGAGRLNAITFADDGTLYALGESAGGAARLLRYAPDGSKLGVGSPSGLAPTLITAEGAAETAAQIWVSMRQGQLSGIGSFARGNSDTAADACRLDCTDPRCGDRVTDSAEACDDGSAAGGDGCAACALEPGWICGATVCTRSCGDGGPDAGEACDDGGIGNGDGCDANCAVEPGWICSGPGQPSAGGLVCAAERCGDRITAGSETCDDGNDAAGDGCDPSCQLEGCGGGPCVTTCGDGIADPEEACDDGDRDAGDGCGPTCAVEPGWLCTIGADGLACVAQRCGDRIAAGDEACDDGNGATGDGCDGMPPRARLGLPARRVGRWLPRDLWRWRGRTRRELRRRHHLRRRWLRSEVPHASSAGAVLSAAGRVGRRAAATGWQPATRPATTATRSRATAAPSARSSSAGCAISTGVVRRVAMARSSWARHVISATSSRGTAAISFVAKKTDGSVMSSDALRSAATCSSSAPKAATT